MQGDSGNVVGRYTNVVKPLSQSLQRMAFMVSLSYKEHFVIPFEFKRLD